VSPIPFTSDLSPLPPSDARALTLNQVCRLTQLSRPSVVRLIKEERLHAIKVGRAWRISAASLAALLDSESSGS